MLKIACFLTGDNYAMLANDTTASRKKIIVLALAMLIPVLIWTFTGFMLANKILVASVSASISTGIFCGVIIFIVEKMVVMAKGDIRLYWARCAIGFLIAILGSIIVDEIVFENDIDMKVDELRTNKLTETKKNAANQFEQIHNYETLNKNIHSAKIEFNEAEREVIREAEGISGTRRHGVGEVTELKQAIALERREDLSKFIIQKHKLDQQKDVAILNAAITADQNFNPHSLLLRIEALFGLVTSNVYMFFVYVLFTLVLFFFEFLTVILKSTMRDTNYDKKIELIEEIGRRRMEFLLSGKSPLIEPGNYLKNLEDVRNTLKTKNSIFN